MVLPQVDDINPETLPGSLRRSHQVVEGPVSTPFLTVASGDASLGCNQHRIFALG